jgi:hypothetical protein
LSFLALELEVGFKLKKIKIHEQIEEDGSSFGEEYF